jgi:hypothetical protein
MPTAPAMPAKRTTLRAWHFTYFTSLLPGTEPVPAPEPEFVLVTEFAASLLARSGTGADGAGAALAAGAGVGGGGSRYSQYPTPKLRPPTTDISAAHSRGLVPRVAGMVARPSPDQAASVGRLPGSPISAATNSATDEY